MLLRESEGYFCKNTKNYNPNKTVEITNAVNYYSKFGTYGKNGDEYFTYVHYYATIHHGWSVKNFPFDRQVLSVRLEDFADTKQIVFQPDILQSSIHPESLLEGWDIIGMTIKESTTHYHTNFGDISTLKGLYSRITFMIEIKRQGWRPYMNYFIGFFVAAFLCMMLCFLSREKLTDRSGLMLGAIFAFIGNKYILDQMMAFSTEYSLGDMIQAATFTMIIATILHWVFWEIIVKDSTKFRKVDYAFGIISGIIYTITVCFFTYRAVVA